MCALIARQHFLSYNIYTQQKNTSTPRVTAINPLLSLYQVRFLFFVFFI